MKGGKPIASGSYGCVFKPALLCQRYGTCTRNCDETYEYSKF